MFIKGMIHKFSFYTLSKEEEIGLSRSLEQNSRTPQQQLPQCGSTHSLLNKSCFL